MPLSSNVSKNMSELADRNAELKKMGKKPRPRSQMVAIALEAAREHGAKLPGKRKG